MLSGIFINTRKANCSIYSSGRMFFDSIKDSRNYTIDYVEINDIKIDNLHQGSIESDTVSVKSSYDFYIFNYHHLTMRDIEKVNSRRFLNLTGKKLCIILEMNKDDPFPYMHPVGFTDFIVLDPTMNRPESTIHAFPRPLSNFREIKKIEIVPEIPIIGSYGYAHTGKCFDLVVKAAADEFKKAHVRINIPSSTYADNWFGSDYKQQIENQCRSHIRDGITIDFTNHFFTDDELIDWCAENTLNCFFYNRNSPGLAAASDQAILSGAPLAIGENTTFRHIHEYIKPYPQVSLRDSILNSQIGIKEMMHAWSNEKCVSRLEEILSK